LILRHIPLLIISIILLINMNYKVSFKILSLKYISVANIWPLD